MRQLVLSVALASACASAPVEFERVEDVLAPTARVPQPRIEPQGSPVFLEALKAFVDAAEARRHQHPRGAAMPPDGVAAWSALLDEVKTATTSPKATVLDLVRARLWLQTALEAEGGHYGDVPADLAVRAQRAIAGLSERLLALSPKKSSRAANPATFSWPVDPVVVTSPWGDRLHPLTGDYQFHAGVDLEATKAQPIWAVAEGSVTFSGWNAGHGKQVELQHDPHLSTRYSHLSALAVQPGDHVRRGDIIGWAGRTGTATGVHLHLELRRDGVSLDPEAELPTPGDALMVAR